MSAGDQRRAMMAAAEAASQQRVDEDAAWLKKAADHLAKMTATLNKVMDK